MEKGQSPSRIYQDASGNLVKKCRRCEGVFPIGNFFIKGYNRKRELRYGPHCLDCHRIVYGAYSRQYNEKNSERLREYWRKYDEARRDEYNAYRRAHRRQHVDYYREYDRQRSPQRRKTESTRKRNKEGQAFRYSKIRVKRIDPKAIRQRDNDICYLCLLPVDERTWTIDHVFPLKRGGEHTEENVKVAHRHCNSRKSNKLLSELEQRPDGTYIL